MPDAFKITDSIAKKAFKKMDKVFGGERDAELEFYNSLTHDDLLHLTKEKGIKPTIEFVKRMEARRLGVRD